MINEMVGDDREWRWRLRFVDTLALLLLSADDIMQRAGRREATQKILIFVKTSLWRGIGEVGMKLFN